MIQRTSTGELNLPELELGQNISLLSPLDKESSRSGTMEFGYSQVRVREGDGTGTGPGKV